MNTPSASKSLTEPPSEDSLNSTIGRLSPLFIPYEDLKIIEPVGKGSFGLVYKAFDYFDICVTYAKPGEEDVNALFKLGHCHLCGRGTPQNKEEARRLIKMAKEKGHHLAGITLQIMDAPKEGNISLNVGDGSIGVSFTRDCDLIRG